MSNLALWDSVCRTDPQFTKQFSRSGGFKGTAISPMYLMRRATEKFGPIGIGWGFSEAENKYIAGVWFSRVKLWYVFDGKRGEVEQWGATTMEGEYKSSGRFVDEEAAKKAITDAVTKCLSYLGFAADVHLGLYDDNKYVAELNAQKRKGKRVDAPDEEAPPDCQPDPFKSEEIKQEKLKVAESQGINVSAQRTSSFGGIVQEFQKLKAEFERLGQPKLYREILGAHGYEHSNEAVKAGTNTAREIYREMRLRVDLLRSLPPDAA